MLKYKFVSASEYCSTEEYMGLDVQFPHAPSNRDQTEFLICGDGDFNEEQMNAYKAANWPKPEEEIT